MKKNIEQGTPCDTCLPPLLPGNVPILEIYNLVEGQIVTDGRTSDINLLALDAVLKRYGIEDNAVFEKVVNAVRYKLSGK